MHAGASGVGLAAIQLAKAAGATVIATASSDDRLDRLTGYGLDHGIELRDRRRRGEVLALTDRKGVNLVVDSVGGHTLEASIAALAYRGRISWVGRAGREDRVPDIWPIMQRNASITGVFLGAEMALDPAAPTPSSAGCSTGWLRASCASLSTAPSRSPTPPTPTATSRAAAPSDASCSSPEWTTARSSSAPATTG